MQCLYFLDHFLDVSKHRIHHLCIKKKPVYASHHTLCFLLMFYQWHAAEIVFWLCQLKYQKPSLTIRDKITVTKQHELATTFQPECRKRRMEFLLNPAHHRHTQGAPHRQQDHKEVQTISSKQRQNKPYPPHALSDVLDCAH